MSSPEIITGLAFSPFDLPRSIELPVNEAIERLMDKSFDEAEHALRIGGTPVGAALIDMETGQEWTAHSIDKISGNIEDHAEKRTYRAAQPVVRDRLGKCALVSTLELCPMCISTFAQGDISTIIIAARRNQLVREDGTPILRQRKISMYDLIEDSAAPTNVYGGYGADKSIGLWRQWDKLRTK